MMSSRPRASKTVAFYLLPALLVVAALVLTLTPKATGATPATASVAWSGTGTGSIIKTALNSLNPEAPSWAANVRANTDATTNGQHEPDLAVSPANPNVVVIAN